MTPLTGATIDIYAPSLPAVAKSFNVEIQLAQLSITFYLLGYGISQIFTGILTDHFGRKPVILTCLSMYLITLFGCAFSPTIYFFLFVRLLQGIFVSGPGVINKAYIIDVIPEKNVQRYINYITIAWAFGLTVGPLLGDYLYNIFHTWKVSFYFLSVYSILIITLLFFTPDTLPKKSRVPLKKLSSNIRLLICNSRYISSVICVGCIYSLLIIFSLLFPFIIAKQSSTSPLLYGKLAFLVGLSWLFGNTMSRVIENQTLSARYIKLFSFGSVLLSGLFLSLNSFFSNLPILMTSLPAIIIIALMSFTFPKLYAFSIALFPQIAGLSGAMMGTSFLLVTTLVTFIISEFSTSITALYLSYATLSLICLLLFTMGIKNTITETT